MLSCQCLLILQIIVLDATPPFPLQRFLMNEFVSIPISQLVSPKHDSRFSTDYQADSELVESVKSVGVILPIIVRKVKGKNEIVAGHRRYKAAMQAGLTSINCIIRKGTDEDLEKIKLHENLHRLPLSHVEQGATFEYLKENFRLSEHKISVLTGKSVPYISQHLTLIHSDPALIKDVQDEKITFSVSRELVKCFNNDDLIYLKEFASKGGATVEVVKNWVNEANIKRQEEPIQASDPPETAYIPTPQSAVFQCKACEYTFPIPEMQISRMCPVCDNAIFSAIREQRQNNTPKIATNTPGVDSVPL